MAPSESTTRFLMRRVDQLIQRTLDGVIQANIPTEEPAPQMPASAPATNPRPPASDSKWGRGMYGQRDVTPRRYLNEEGRPAMHNSREGHDRAGGSGRNVYSTSKQATPDQRERYKRQITEAHRKISILKRALPDMPAADKQECTQEIRNLGLHIQRLNECLGTHKEVDDRRTPEVLDPTGWDSTDSEVTGQ